MELFCLALFLLNIIGVISSQEIHIIVVIDTSFKKISEYLSDIKYLD